MTPFVGALVLLLGASLGVPGMIALGVVGLGLGLAQIGWRHSGSGIVRYRRQLATDRTVCGESIDLEVSIENRGPLPLPWVRTVDGLGAGVMLEAPVSAGAPGDETPNEERRVGPGRRAELAASWTLGPFAVRSRTHRILTTRRGAYELGPATVTAGDLLGVALPIYEEPARTRYLVRPRMVAVREVSGPRDWEGERRADHGLADDASRPAGVRPYRPGDPLRRIHWRATARTGRPVTRRFDPARRRDTLLVVDLRLPTWAGRSERDDLTEGLIVTTMSLARALHVDGAAVGLAVAGFSRSGRMHLFLPPNATPGGLGLLADVLARLDGIPSMAFPDLLDEVSQRVAPGTTIVSIGTVDPTDAVPALRRLRRSGFGVLHVGFGPDGAAAATRLAAAGIPARTAHLDADWSTSTRLDLVG